MNNDANNWQYVAWWMIHNIPRSETKSLHTTELFISLVQTLYKYIH